MEFLITNWPIIGFLIALTISTIVFIIRLEAKVNGNSEEILRIEKEMIKSLNDFSMSQDKYYNKVETMLQKTIGNQRHLCEGDFNLINNRAEISDKNHYEAMKRIDNRFDSMEKKMDSINGKLDNLILSFSTKEK